jgi:hypothetical protein
LETEICSQRLSTARVANEPQRRWNRLSRPTDAAASRGNVVLFYGGGNHSGLRRLPGGAEGIQTDDHRGRGEISSGSPLGVRPPAPGRLGGGFAFRRPASRYREEEGPSSSPQLTIRRRKEPKASRARKTGIPVSTPRIAPENTIPQPGASAGMRKERSFRHSLTNGANRPLMMKRRLRAETPRP